MLQVSVSAMLLLAAVASATTHAPPWRRVVRAVQEPHLTPSPMQRVGSRIEQQVRQQLAELHRVLQQQLQQRPQQQPQMLQKRQQTQQRQQPQQQSHQQQSQQQPLQQSHQQQPQQQQGVEDTQPLTETLGSSLLRDLQRYHSAPANPAPTLSPGPLSPRPFHRGVAKAVIAETNREFSVPQDPSVLGVSSAVLTQAAEAGAGAGAGGVLRSGDGENNTVLDEVSEPSKCVWAIVSCCTPQPEKVRYSCFELLGCQGAFWDISPCDQTVAKAALQQAIKYYQRGGKRKEKPRS